MAVGNDEIPIIEDLCVNIIGDQDNISRCEYSLRWVLDRLEEWGDKTTVGEQTISNGRILSNSLQDLDAEVRNLVAYIRGFLADQSNINTTGNKS